jgi:hypothetical protein
MSINQPNPASLVSRASLPIAAQRWLSSALSNDVQLPASIRIEQTGTMDIRGRWTAFQASGMYTAAPLAFDWRAKFRILAGIWILAEDGHRDGHGWGSARLWGRISLGKRTDEEVLISQLVRNLGELPWLPSFALLADPNLTWTEAGETAFGAHYTAGSQEAMVRYDIDERGDIIRAYSPARPYDVPSGYEVAPWYYEFSDHQDFGGVRIPGAAVARFEKSGSTWEYFRCKLSSVV